MANACAVADRSLSVMFEFVSTAEGLSVLLTMQPLALS
jgi:hypothetical protein